MKAFRKKCFTLIELLVTISILVFLIGFFASMIGSKFSDRGKIVRTKHRLSKIADAIKMYESDWGILPSSLYPICNLKPILEITKAKNIKLIDPHVYYETREKASGKYVKGYGYSCPLYDETSAPKHAHHILAEDINKYTYCKEFYHIINNNDNGNQGGACNELLDYTKKNETIIDECILPADTFGNQIFYTKANKSNDYGFMLISLGPDGKGSPDSKDVDWIGARAIYEGNGADDKDNIIYSTF